MKISIIIEWENLLLSEVDRCVIMLKTLQKQVISLNLPTEIIILSNPEQIQNETVQSIANNNIYFSKESLAYIRFEEAIGYHYYELKNYGASLANGDIIIFIDTDVIPDNNWLYELTIPFIDDSEINVVAGNTYIDPVDIVGKAFSLGWFFPTKKTKSKIVITRKGFFSNNVAFRKTVIEKFPFPKMPLGMTRGACEMLTEKLIEQNIPIYFNTAAQMSHPAPNGWKHFTTRALANGRDRLLRRKMKYASSLKNYFFLYSYAASRIKQTLYRSFDAYDYFKLSAIDKALGNIIMLIYYFLLIIGGTLTVIFPNLTAKWWRI